MRANKILYREFWGETKRADLLATLDNTGAEFEASYTALQPTGASRFNLRRTQTISAYTSWADVREIAAVEPISGLQEMRRNRLIETDRASLVSSMTAYLDPTKTLAELSAAAVGPTEPAGGFDPNIARTRLLQAGEAAVIIRRYAFQPLDLRWCAWTHVPTIWNRPRPDLAREIDGRTPVFITRMVAERPHEQIPAFVTRALPDYHLLRPNIVAFPFVLHGTAESGNADLLAGVDAQAVRPNLSRSVVTYLTTLGISASESAIARASLIWLHALAVCCAPAYLEEYGPAIRQGWPRIPLPGDAAMLATSAALGEQVAVLLDPDTPVPGVTAGQPRPELATIAVPATAKGATRDWTLTGWGHRSDKGVTMPGRGRADARSWSEAEVACTAHAATLGATTRDVWMNGASFWRNIPEAVWETHIGGYQVIKKWLSYRDGSILGRPLTEAEVAQVQAMVRRLAALRLLGPALDASFLACTQSHVPLIAPAQLTAAK